MSCVEQHMDLIEQVARATSKRHRISYEAALSGACLGVMDALKRYDESRGTAFLSVRARWQILDDIRNDSRWFACGAGGMPRGYKRPVGVELKRQLPPLSCDGVAEKVRSKSTGRESIDHGDVFERMRQSADTSVEDTDSFKVMVAGLSREDRMILTLLYVEGMNQREVGKAIGVSESFVSYAHKRLLKQLKGRLCA